MPEETFETPQPTPPVEQKSTDWTRIVLAAFVGLGLLAASAYAGYWYGTESSKSKPTSVVDDETTDWKTYTNKVLGFSVRYPGTWPPPEERILSTRTEIEWDSLTITVGVVYDQNKERELSYSEIVQRQAYDKEPDHISIDGQPAVYLKMRDEDLPYPKPNPYNSVVVQKERIVYQLHAVLPVEEEFPEEHQRAQTIFDQILSTFKFLE